MKNSNYLIAMDSFKGSGSSKEIGTFIELGILDLYPEANVKVIPIADGGEGTLEAFECLENVRIIESTAHNSLGKLIPVKIGLMNNDSEAIIEAAQTIGLHLTEINYENAIKGSSFGVGEQIIQALNLKVDHIYVGLGGSSTNDGGIGMARALGVEFYDTEGKAIASGLHGIKDLETIDISNLDKRIFSTKFTILSDVDNYLTGEVGAIKMFGEQKGLPVSKLGEYDTWMNKYRTILKENFNFESQKIKGTGAAGGLGTALQLFCQSEQKNGIETILELIGFENLVKESDFVFTGEGCMDEQSLYGKAPMGIGTISKKYGKPVIVLVGGKKGNINSVYKQGITCVFPIIQEPSSLEIAIKNTKNNIIETTKTVLRCMDISVGI